MLNVLTVEANMGGNATRTADVNALKKKGNVVVIAARVGELPFLDTEDYVKIKTLQYLCQ